MSIQKPKGTQDLLPGEVEKWQYLETKARDLCQRFNYKEIRSPIFESTELYSRGVGETTDIVEKEMYTFLDKGDRSMTLRPEGTAGVVRAYVENKLYGDPRSNEAVTIWDRCSAMNSRKLGDIASFTSLVLKLFGSVDPSIDAEVIALGYTFYKEIGLKMLLWK